MALEFQNISYAYEAVKVLDDVSFTADRGKVTCLLGPSGCGKTTLLRIAAGLLAIQSGEIGLNGELLAKPGQSPPPEKRPVGLVFQEGALFPHLTVLKNVIFGLEQEPNHTAQAKKLLNQVGLKGFEERYPHTLSGGQQQRVALARALAPTPQVLLLDEPFANIDSQLRRSLSDVTRRMLIETDTVAVLVTHDPDEAMYLADHLVVLNEGRLIQAGSPENLFDAPKTKYIARLFGNGQIVNGKASNEGIETPFGLWSSECLANTLDQPGFVQLVVRPDALNLTKVPGTCTVIDTRWAGSNRRVRVDAPNGEEIVCLVEASQSWQRGDSVSLTPKDRSIFAFS